MATFNVRVVRLQVEPHQNADALELARVGDYLSVVRKGQFLSGDLGAYIPEQAIVPVELLREMGLEGRLAGKDADRVKAIKLRGVLSQGLVYPAREGWTEGQDVTALLGITKYEPPVPTDMSGEVYAAGLERCMRYDIENIKAWPEVFTEGEPVVFTEKIHGTWTQLGLMPEALAHPEHGRLVVCSKGLGGRGLAFMPFAEANANNLYLRVARALDIEARIEEAFPEAMAAGEPVFVLGETFGRGVQDLDYGAVGGTEPSFRVFDVYVGLPGQGRYLDDHPLDMACARLDLERVPVVYRGRYSRAALADYTDGDELVSFERRHLREGVVVRPRVERRHDGLGRVQLKSISARYLLRKGGTEFN
ncbi:MAG: RNA ligase (ATP) [Alphaproteobacteria bacterium]|nr:RNA ligase (ATP) [Alphaproteobacteria bacterium]MCB9796911.1 RNA ligase (ATP) [Alphaproteobacteria bacterium]